MQTHNIKVVKGSLKKEHQLAWKLAKCALDPAPLSKEVCDMLINRIIDNAGVAIASLERTPVSRAKDQAMAYPHPEGALIFGCANDQKFLANWSAYANGVAVRELDFHDTFLAEDYSHPADNIPPILAVAQQTKKEGHALLKALNSAYEIHIALVKAICLHKHKIDHIAHLCPAQTAGIGALLSMDVDKLYQAINQAVHVSFTTRQSRKGDISSWKAYAPAHAGKLAIEAIDRAWRGEKSPSPIYEGADSVIAWLLDGPLAEYKINLPEKGEQKQMILESYTKAYSAEYQAQAFIDLAFDIRKQIKDLKLIKEIIIHTSHHTHYVIGTGSGDKEKFNPQGSRETLDHSLMYIVAVALEDGKWHHIDSYTQKRANQNQTIKLWQKIKTKEDKKWTALYHHPNPLEKGFGGRMEIVFQDGSRIEQEKKRAKAHPAGEKPFKRADYIQKFMELSQYAPVREQEKTRFLSLVQKLPNLSAKEVAQINIQAPTLKQKLTIGILD